MSAQRMVVARDLGRTYRGPYGPITALKNVNFIIEPGRVVLLLGENGAGKSTLVHLACQVLRPTTGRVSLGISHGHELGWCSQAQMIDWWATVWANVNLGPRLAGQTRQQAHTSTREALSLARLTDVADRHCDALSGGQLQRVQVARALASEPRLLFLDEPTVGMDASSSRQLLGDLRRRAEGGATVIVASHELELVECYCDEVLLLHEGRLVVHSSREEFLKSWTDEEIAEIDYDGQLSAQQLRLIRAATSELLQERPLRAIMPRGESHRLLQVLGGMVQIRQFRLEVPGLREAYLRFREQQETAGAP